MFVHNPKSRRPRPALGATAVGLAVGIGAYATGADPNTEPAAPRDEVTVWTPAAPQVGSKSDSPTVPTLPQPDKVLPMPPAPTLPAPSVGPSVPVLPAPVPGPASLPSLALPAPALPAPTLPAPGVLTSTKPAALELAPAPAAVVGAVAEVAPMARPAKSVELPQPVELPRPDFNLRPASPDLNVIPGLPAPTTLPAPSLPAPQPPTHEDAPMPLLPTRQLLMSAALGAALAASPASAQAPMTEKKDTPAPDAAKLLEDIKKDVGDLKKARTDIEDVIYGRADGKTAADQGIMRRLSDLEAKLQAIQSALSRIESTLKDSPKSTSAYTAPGTAGTTSPKAFVRLVNDYPTDVSMMVNGRSYRLAPGEVKTVDVAVGNYTYELLHAGAQSKTAAIKEGETVTLRVN